MLAMVILLMAFKNQHKSLLILDLDETLVHATDSPLERAADFTVFKYQVYRRPFLDEFLNQAAQDYQLAIWSSASDDYVEYIARRVVPKHIRLEFCWGRSRCTQKYNSGMNEDRYYDLNRSSYYYFTKPLKKVRRKGYMLDRILIVDDSPHKVRSNYGNAIYPRPFKGDENDQELLYLGQYLQTLKDKENVRRIEKRNWRHIVGYGF